MLSKFFDFQSKHHPCLRKYEKEKKELNQRLIRSSYNFHLARLKRKKKILFVCLQKQRSGDKAKMKVPYYTFLDESLGWEIVLY